MKSWVLGGAIKNGSFKGITNLFAGGGAVRNNRMCEEAIGYLWQDALLLCYVTPLNHQWGEPLCIYLIFSLYS
jgi:hypothetical protein